jgi:hypothetical protein
MVSYMTWSFTPGKETGLDGCGEKSFPHRGSNSEQFRPAALKSKVLIIGTKFPDVQRWILNYTVPLSFWRNSPTRARAASFLRFLDHTQWHTTVGRTPLYEGSVCRRELYVITFTRDRHPCHLRYSKPQ